MNKKIRKNKGITLIALVVTIVVLLILAGTSISMLTGDNGIITNSQIAAIQNEVTYVAEQVELACGEYAIEYSLEPYHTGYGYLFRYLSEQGYIKMDHESNCVTINQNKEEEYLGEYNYTCPKGFFQDLKATGQGNSPEEGGYYIIDEGVLIYINEDKESQILLDLTKYMNPDAYGPY